MRRIAVAAALVAGGAACWVPAETGSLMQQQIQALQKDQQSLTKNYDMQHARLLEQMQKADEQLQAIDEKIQELNRAARMTDADFGVQLEEIRKELQSVRGEYERTNFRVTQLEEKQVAATATRTEPPPVTAEKNATAAETKKPEDAKGLLAQGRSLTKDGKTQEALGVFRQVIHKAPKEKGVADAAYYELGELYYKDKKYRSALQEYIQVVEKFATGAFVDDAYYRIGMCSMALANYEDAAVFFEEIIKNHKESPLLAQAQKRLDEAKRKIKR